VKVLFHPKPSGELIVFPGRNLEGAIRKIVGVPEKWRPIYESDLPGVKELDFGRKNITDLSWIQHCTNLQRLNLQSNQIGDIAPLSRLTKLRMLDLSSNQISDVSPLSSLTALRVVYLDNNLIKDISALESLTKIGRGKTILLRREGIEVQLGLSKNRISDISPLVRNSGIGKRDVVDLRGNPLSSHSINKLIPQLQQRGVKVLYDKPE
jgi:Leucine-rich repeat (LRR) protein